MSQSEYWNNFMRRRLGRRTILKGGALAGVGLLTGSAIGCQSAAPTAATPAASSTTAPAAAASPTAVPKKAATGKAVILAGSPRGEVMDPHRMHHSMTTWRMWTDDLMMADEKGASDKGLATSWTVAPDGLAWTFKLRKGVLFHDETEMTAEDVKFSFERQQKFEKNPMTGVMNTFFDHTEIVDPYTIKFVFKKPQMDFLVQLQGMGRILPKKYIEKVGDDYFLEHPMGTGPWKVAKWEQGVTLELEAFEKHYRGVPGVKNVKSLTIPDAATRMAMLQSGEADILPAIPPTMIEEVKARPGMQVITKYPAASWEGRYATAGAGKIWLDERVRKAFMYAFDREKVAKNVMKGTAGANVNTWLPVTFGWNPDLKPWPFDPAKAKQLMAEAGYPNGIDVAVYTVNSTEFMERAQGMAAVHAEVGLFRMKMVTNDGTTWIGQIRTRTLPEDIPGIWWATGNEGYTWNGDAGWSALAQQHSKAPYCYPMGDPKLDEMIEAQAQITDVEKRKKALQELAAYEYEHQYFPAGWYTSMIAVAGPKVKSWKPLDTYSPLYETVELKS